MEEVKLLKKLNFGEMLKKKSKKFIINTPFIQ